MADDTSVRDDGQPAGLSISDLADRTGVSAATLRTWESRYGYPSPRRLAGGHRRYLDRDVDAIKAIVRRRSTGQTISTAIAATVAQFEQPEPSIFAGLRRRRPDLQPRVVRKPTLLALSRAIEDECCARADDPVLFASFQKRHFYEQVQYRWIELARTARSVIIFADFDEQPESGDTPLHVPVPARAALRREWVLVCEASDYPACVAGWEHPGQDALADADRRFETIWTVDPQAVRDAARICARLAESYTRSADPAVAQLLADEAPPPASDDLRRADGLLNRTLGYLDATAPR
ncbi:MerR family transcriptional regulator [Nocardioidaceae bacterium SCSIO 66511]|nr:MerR family transcriptional regulator [Nocardioidaceae bacterium SCSIO 66511]